MKKMMKCFTERFCIREIDIIAYRYSFLPPLPFINIDGGNSDRVCTTGKYPTGEAEASPV
ncbi:hypothetical protein ABLB84_10110 [Xenorhabdus szentirmaii]|uniref:hypothetical protein n=1 Tax=Xenorhabdus szentirmaii TaxID=290112 RepID=UPI0032B72590